MVSLLALAQAGATGRLLGEPRGQSLVLTQTLGASQFLWSFKIRNSNALPQPARLCIWEQVQMISIYWGWASMSP